MTPMERIRKKHPNALCIKIRVKGEPYRYGIYLDGILRPGKAIIPKHHGMNATMAWRSAADNLGLQA